MTLIRQIFGIQDELVNVLPLGWMPVDQGMFLPKGEETEIWRDLTCQHQDGREFCISYSTTGNLKHQDVPQYILKKIKTVLRAYRK